ncbi:transmembrane-type terpene cyclase [Nocardia sp. NPDC003482]
MLPFNFLPPALIQMSHIAPATLPEATNTPWLYWGLMGPAAVGWLSAYGLAIHRGFVDKYVAIPAFLVLVNFAWEFNLALVLDQGTTQRHINFSWAALNTIIVFQAFKYGWKDFPSLSKGRFRSSLIGIFLWASVMVMVSTNEFGDVEGAYTGTVINIPLSAAFIFMLRARRSSVGQSMYIAIFKCIGSIFAGLTAFVQFQGRYLFFPLFATILVLDLSYIYLLHQQIRREGGSPWDLNRPRVYPSSGARELPPSASTTRLRVSEELDDVAR